MRCAMRAFRIWLCEILCTWSLEICPSDYTPACVDAVLKAYDAGLNKKPISECLKKMRRV